MLLNTHTYTHIIYLYCILVSHQYNYLLFGQSINKQNAKEFECRCFVHKSIWMIKKLVEFTTYAIHFVCNLFLHIFARNLCLISFNPFILNETSENTIISN